MYIRALWGAGKILGINVFPALCFVVLAGSILPQCLAVWAAEPKPSSGTSKAQQLRKAMLSKIAANWVPTRTSKAQTIRVRFKIRKDGTVSDLKVLNQGKEVLAEKRASEAVLKSAPFTFRSLGNSASVDMELEFQTVTELHLSLSQALKHYGPSARELLTEKCKAAGLSYPPRHLTLIGLKQERKLLMFASNDANGRLSSGGRLPVADKDWKLIASYPLVSYSGVLGPKLKEGDLQIPEGLYEITGFQSFSMLSLCVNYPNQFDRKMAATERRSKLGGDILIHGGSHSTGCLVVSNEDMEQVFVAANDLGCRNIRLIIAPCKLTDGNQFIDFGKQPKWLPGLYEQIKAELLAYPIP